MSVNEKAAEILEKAADGFESGRYGWIRGHAYARDWQTGEEARCAVGALQHETAIGQIRDIRSPESRALIGVLTLAERKLAEVAEVRDVPHWNDYLATDVTEIVDKMKEAAKNLRNGELA